MSNGNEEQGSEEIQAAEKYTILGDQFYREGKFIEALEPLESARRVYLDNNLAFDIAKIDNNIGVVLNSLGRYEEALNRYESARKVYLDNHLALKAADIDQNIGNVHESLGHYEEALSKYESARKIYLYNNLTLDVAGIDQNIGVVLSSLGRYKEALNKYESAKKIYLYNNLALKAAEIGQNIGNALSFLGRYEEALSKYEFARKVYFDKNHTLYVTEINCNIGNALSSLGRYEEALSKYESARKVFLDNNLTLNAARIDHNIGVVHKCLGRYKEAFRSFKQAIEAVREHKFFFKKDNIKTDFLETVLNIYESMIDLCLKQGKVEEALEYTEEIKSQNLVEKLAQKSLKPSDNTPKELTEEFERLRRKLIGISLQFGNNDNPERTERLSKEIPIVEKKLDEILSHIREHDPEFDPFFKKRIKMEEITALIPDNATAIIEIFPFKDKTAVFVVRKDKPVQETTIINEKYGLEQLNPAVEEFIKYYEAKSPDWILIMNTLLARLYKEIFVEAKKHLDGIERIIFIPYGVLHRVPLHAMYYSEDLNGQKHYLIDDYIISFAPSASILKSSIDKARHKSDTGNMKIATANPYNDLEKIYVEAKAIQRLYPNSEYQRDVNINNFSKLAQQAEILHYAGHGDSESLALQDGKLKMEDVFADYRMPMCRLMVMSACETGITQLGATDEHIGISSAFLYAGASTVVSSLWKVRDDTTSLLMRKMYENIQEGLSTADALRQAQLWLKDNNKKNEHEAMLYRPYANHDSNVSSLPHQPSSNLLPSSTSVNRAPRDPANETKSSTACPDYDSIYYWAGFISSGNFSI